MAGLQAAFYIISIFYMGISLLLIFGLVVTGMVIRAKVVSLEKMITEKIDTITSWTSHTADAIGKVKKIVSHDV